MIPWLVRSRPGHRLLHRAALGRVVIAGIIAGGLAGCGGGEGEAPDLDGDGIADLDDECQTTEADGRGDLDGDALPNATDPCPFDAAPHLGDADGDGVPESCDPFPATSGADVQRCVTAFVAPVITEGYLAPRAGEVGWTLGPPLATDPTGATAVSMVSIFPASEHRSTTYELIGTASFATADASSYVKLWLRAGAAPSDDDVACGIDGTGSVVVFRGPERTGVRPLPNGAAGGMFRLRATVQAGTGNTVLCRVTIGGGSVATTSNVPLVEGTFGFAAAAVTARLEGFVSYSRDDAPPF